MKNRNRKLGFLAGILAMIAGLFLTYSLVFARKEGEVLEAKEDSTSVVRAIVDTEGVGASEKKTRLTSKLQAKDEVKPLEVKKTGEDVKEKRKERFTPIIFVDAYKKKHKAMIDNSLKMHNYDVNKFKRKGNLMTYDDEDYTSRVGIDVSHHQKVKDWKKVKKAGIDFSFIRLGARGYGESGGLIKDREFEYNLKNAKKAGIEVGVYFYSQAVNEKEALEEADFVLNNLKGRKLDLPVIYDPEHVYAADKVTLIGRNSKVSKKQFTKNALTFLKRVEDSGYMGGIYANMLWLTGQYELGKLEDYILWFADYEKKPQSPYAYEYWQYSSEGRLNSVDGLVDMNIRVIKK